MFVATILAPGTLEPDLSFTVPVSCAVWLNAVIAKTPESAINRIVFISTSSTHGRAWPVSISGFGLESVIKSVANCDACQDGVDFVGAPQIRQIPAASANLPGRTRVLGAANPHKIRDPSGSCMKTFMAEYNACGPRGRSACRHKNRPRVAKADD